MSQKKVLESETKKTLRAVLLSNKNGVPLSELEKQYREYGDPRGIPFVQLGFHTLRNYLESIPDTVNVSLYGSTWVITGVEDESTRHIKKLVQNQKQADNKKRPLLPPQPPPRSRMPSRQLRNDIVKLLKSNRGGVHVNHLEDMYFRTFQRYMDYRTNGFHTVLDLVKSMREDLDLKGSTVFPGKQHLMEWQSSDMEHDHGDDQGDEDGLAVTKFVRNNLRALVANYPQGLSVARLPVMYEARYGRPLDCRDYQCQSNAQFCLQLNDVFKTKKLTAKGDWLVFPLGVSTADSTMAVWHSPDTTPDSKSIQVLPLPKKIEMNLKKTLLKFPGGCDSEKFCEYYLDTTRQMLDYTQCGHKTLVEFLCSLDFVTMETTKAHFPLAKDRWIVSLNVKQFLNVGDQVENYFREKTSFDEVEKENPSSKLTVPKMFQKATIEQEKLPSNLRVGCMVEVYIGEIFHPDMFWIQLAYGQLEALMADLRQFYEQATEKYELRPDMVVGGMYVAALYEGCMHRALIRSVQDSKSSVEVFYMDYGTVGTVRLDEMRRLHGKFTQLPAQAIKAKLAGIVPTKGHKQWSKKTAETFLELVSGKCLEATVQALATDPEPWLSLILTDPDEFPDNVNVKLVSMGLAQFDPTCGATSDRVAAASQQPQQPFVPSPTARDLLLPAASSSSFSDLEKLQSSQSSERTRLVRPQPLKVASAFSPIPKKPQHDVSLEFDIDKPMVKAVKLTSTHDDLHIVNVKGTACVTSAEISSLFPRWKNRDVLDKMIDLKKAGYQKLVIGRDAKHDFLFEQCILEGVNGIEVDGHIVDNLNLYMLSDVPDMLRLFSSEPNREVLQAVEKQVSSFDADDDFWLGKLERVN